MSKPKILLLDDDAGFRKDFLVLFGDDYTIFDTDTEEEFWRIYQQDGPFDLLVIDWLLDPSDSTRTSESILQTLSEKEAESPRLVLTAGEGEVETSQRVSELGCEMAFKTEEWDDIAEKIRAIIEGKQPPGASKDEMLLVEAKERKREKEKREKAKAYSDDWINVCDHVVDNSITFEKFCMELLQFIMCHFEARAAAVLTFDRKAAVLAVRKPSKHDDESHISIETIHVTKLGKPRELRTAVAEAISDLEYDDIGQVPAKERANFSGLLHKDIVSAGTLLLEPLCKAKSPSHKSGDEGVEGDTREVEAFGAVLVYPYPTDSKEDLKAMTGHLTELPLSTPLHAARDMPFRQYEEKGMLLRKCALKLVRCFRAVFLLAAFLVPLSFLYFLVYGFVAGDPSIELLKGIGLALIFFTFLLFSIGLMVLYDPHAARILPSWMIRFARPPEIERTVLASAVSILSLVVVSMFVAKLQCYKTMKQASKSLHTSAAVIEEKHNNSTNAIGSNLTDAAARLDHHAGELRTAGLAPSVLKAAEDLAKARQKIGPNPPVPPAAAVKDLLAASDRLATEMKRTKTSSLSDAVDALKKSEAALVKSSGTVVQSNATTVTKDIEKLKKARKDLDRRMTEVRENSTIGILWCCLGAVGIIIGITVFLKFGIPEPVKKKEETGDVSSKEASEK